LAALVTSSLGLAFAEKSDPARKAAALSNRFVFMVAVWFVPVVVWLMREWI
jgi:hypothetical protein